ncbi:MAG: acyl-CoA dehydrogenase [Pseudomonadota bacterium]
MPTALILLGFVVLIALLYGGRGYMAWVGAVICWLTAWAVGGIASPVLFALVAVVMAALAAVFGVESWRQKYVSQRIIRSVQKQLPQIGETERIALEAGTVWWDGDLFSGRPDWQKLLGFKSRLLSDKERAFLDGPVEELCRMVDDWQIAQDRDLPPEIWDFLKKHKFFGMIIPESHGGLGFSAIAHSAVVAKVSSRSVPTACTLMVPNSLGPAELLLHYGTEDQRQYFLPRLAVGEEIPCFALTGPEAGSDAASTESTGVICRGEFQGQEVLGIRLNWRKRYITLAPVATVIGLAFRLYDPDALLGDEEDLGITCALIPAGLSGIDIGRRHDPMGVPFANGPIVGIDVFVPMDFVIGGADGVGEGWKMLMESLAVGRSISLPALSVGAAQLATRVTGAYGAVREQFGRPIGDFEGIEEPLARIAGLTYLMNASRVLTCAAVDAGEKPSVLSAVVKAYLTGSMRGIVNDAMDIRAGAAICRGRNNVLGRGFVAVPIGITVEGSNILTRSMIVFGQGAIRCHPYLQAEMTAVKDDDVPAFDQAIFGHLSFLCQNMARSFVLALSSGRVAGVPGAGHIGRQQQHFTRLSAAFALVADATTVLLGGALKRKEKLSGRLSDALAWLYMGSATIKRYHDAGQPAEDRQVMTWACEHALYQVQEALLGVLRNYPNRLVAMGLYAAIFPLGPRFKPPSDRLGGQVARDLLGKSKLRDRLTADIYVPEDEDFGLARLEGALDVISQAKPVAQKLKDAKRSGKLNGALAGQQADVAFSMGLIRPDEHERITAANRARDEAIQVDAYEPETYHQLRG